MVTEVMAFWCVCERVECGHQWFSGELPKRCAKCKGRSWNKSGKRSGVPTVASLSSLRLQGGSAASDRVATALAQVATVERVVEMDADAYEGSQCE